MPDIDGPDHQDHDHQEADQEELEARARVLHDEIQRLNEAIGHNSLKAVEKRVELGLLLEELRPIIKLSEPWVPYLLKRILPFAKSTAYLYMAHAVLYRAGLSFQEIGNLEDSEISKRASELRGTAQNAQSHERRRRERAARTREAGQIVSGLPLPQLRRLAAIFHEGVDRNAVWEQVLDAAAAYYVEEEPPPVDENGQELGLSQDGFDFNSGAYTAMTQDAEIDINQYEACLTTNSWIHQFFTLDVPDEWNPDETAELSLINTEILRDRGHRPLEVFHVGEDTDYLRRMLDRNPEVIGIAASPSRSDALDFYEQCFEIRERGGYRTRFHALGDSTSSHLTEFPFESADSASWILGAEAFRNVNIARFGEGLTDPQQRAARVFTTTHRAHRLERAIRELRPSFQFYLVIRPDHPFCLPALRVVGHYHAMCSFYYCRRPQLDLLHKFILQPDAVLRQPKYAQPLALLEWAKQRYHEL